MGPAEYGLQIGNQLQRAGDSAASYYLMFDRNRREQAKQDYEISFKERAWQNDLAKMRAQNDLEEATSKFALQDMETQRSAMPYMSAFQRSLAEAQSQALVTGDPTPLRNLQLPQELLDTKDPKIIGEAYVKRYEALKGAESLEANGTIEAQFRKLRGAVNKFAEEDPSFGTDSLGLMSEVNRIEAEAKESLLRTGVYSISEPSRVRLQEMGQMINMRLGEKEVRESGKSVLPKMYDATLQERKSRDYSFQKASDQQLEIFAAEDQSLNEELSGYQRMLTELYKAKSSERIPSQRQAIEKDIALIEPKVKEIMGKKASLVEQRKEFLQNYQQGVSDLDNIASSASSGIPATFKGAFDRQTDQTNPKAKNSALVYGQGGKGGGKKFKNENSIKRAVQEGKYTVEEALRKIDESGAEASPDLIDFLYQLKQRGP